MCPYEKCLETSLMILVYMLKMNCKKRQSVEEIELLNQEKIRTHEEKKNCKYSRILEADIINLGEMNVKSTRMPRWMRKLLVESSVAKI